MRRAGVDLRSLPPELLVWITLGAVAIALVQLLFAGTRGALRRRRMRIRFERAAEGERRAARVLERNGYLVLGAQVQAEHRLVVDTEDVIITLRADYLVERRGRRYVAEVKTGRYAPHVENGATRRQILEYRVAFDVDGVLLVDGDLDAIQEITFPALAGHARGSGGFGTVCAVVVLAAAAIGVARFL